jgi:hypothetical protein
MWPATFPERLASWKCLRIQCQDLAPEIALERINQWWFDSPWQPYYLHWDDQESWPDPWTLLNDNVYCDLARSLGIMYTISMLDRRDLSDAVLIMSHQGHNLVTVSQSKYILNWSPDTVVNTLPEIQCQQQLELAQISQKYN